jgi:hypothetical protein
MGAALLTALGLSWSLLRAQLQLAADFTGSDQVETLTVRIDLTADGDELNEPVALDLGLGFPLWLHPVGRAAGETLPFGAFAQTATVAGPVAPGTSATFTFDLNAEPGQDRLRTTSQLLDGIQISDISRIGFASHGGTNWTLAGYDIQINGRPFASHAEINLGVQTAHEAARLRQAELDLTIGPLETEAADLRSLVEAGLATADDQERLRDVESTLTPMQRERQRLVAQLEGSYPWFEEVEFVSPWRTPTPVAAAQVTLVTDAHPGADTRNFVYFRTGGHKYLLSTPDTPLNAESGPQEFHLELIAGPLTAADLRGYAVGMLGHGGLNGATPDRWHPERVLVAIDGRVVYDSEESEVDRLSLEAIRLIPPAHIGDDGGLVTNTPIARETFVWHAGSGAGLDLAHGGVAPLPAPDDPAYPDPEAGLEAPPLDMDINIAIGDEYPLFPGEFGPGWGPGWGPGGWGPGWEPDLPWWPDAAPPFPWGGLMPWFPGLWDELVHHLLDDLFDDIIPIFDPFQVDNVQIAAGWREGDAFTVTWDVTGNAGEVADFTVQLLRVHPHDDPFLIGPPVAVALHVPAGARSWVLPVPVGGDPYLHVRPVVTAWPAHPALEHDTTTGPARPVFPLATPDGIQPIVATDFMVFPAAISPSVDFTGDPPPIGRSAWYFAGRQGHIDLDFGDPAPGYNMAFRPAPGDAILIAGFGTVTVPAGHYRIVANVGFLGGADANNTATFHLVAQLVGGLPHNSDVTLAVTPGVPEVMPLLEVVVDTAEVGIGPQDLNVVIAVEDGVLDFDHPPAFFGLRVIPE